MKKAGYIMITIGFLAGSLVAVLHKADVQWNYFVGALILGGIGIVLVHLGEHKDSHSEEKLTANLQDIEASLSRIVENITHFNEENKSMNPYDVHPRVDELFAEDLITFAEAREGLARAHGLHVYADVMSHFAAGERYLNRVWSASADGYIDEVNTFIGKAEEQFSVAFDQLKKLEASRP